MKKVLEIFFCKKKVIFVIIKVLVYVIYKNNQKGFHE